MDDDSSSPATPAEAGADDPQADRPTGQARPARPARPAAAAKKAPARKSTPRKTAAKSTATKSTATKSTARSTARKAAVKSTAEQATATRDAQVSASGPEPHGFASASSGVAQANTEQELAGHDVDPDYAGTDDSLHRDPTDHPMDLEQGVADFTRSVGAPAGIPTATGPASAADVEAAWKDNTLAQVLYHDWEAGTYDEKWSISFDERCISYARERFSNLLGADVLRAERWPYAKALEIGAGTGFFSLNLKQAGVVDEVYVTDVSPGMVQAAKRNAHELGFEVQGEAAFAEDLPYPDDTFDVVVGHAVIHHIPDVEAALREILRVLKPGGRFVIAGEPTRIGDWYARRLGRVTWKLTTGVTHLPRLRERWAKSQEELDASSRAAALEAIVDLHTFVPAELSAMANRAGAQNVHTQTEELLAALLGWPVRTFEAAVNPERLGWGWSMFAYKSWLRLSAVDRVLSRALPKGIFYNVGITGTKSLR